MYVCALSRVRLSVIPGTVAGQTTLCPWDFPGKNTGVGCHFLLQRIFQTRGSNLHLLCPLHWQVGSLPNEPPAKPINRRGSIKQNTPLQDIQSGESRYKLNKLSVIINAAKCFGAKKVEKLQCWGLAQIIKNGIKNDMFLNKELKVTREQTIWLFSTASRWEASAKTLGQPRGWWGWTEWWQVTGWEGEKLPVVFCHIIPPPS